MGNKIDDMKDVMSLEDKEEIINILLDFVSEYKEIDKKYFEEKIDIDKASEEKTKIIIETRDKLYDVFYDVFKNHFMS